MQASQKRILELTDAELVKLFKGENVTVDVEGEPLELTPEDVQVERLVKEGLIASTVGEVTIALDTTLTEDLLLEGLAREIVNKVNTIRRESKFDVTDRIQIKIDSTPRLKIAFELHKAWISEEVLATSVEFTSVDGPELDLNGEISRILVSKTQM